MQNETFPAKILLFGEYTLLTGSKAICVPYWKLNGKWSLDKGNYPRREQSQEHLKKFLAEATLSGLDEEKFKSEVADGLWFDSTVPQGYGIGSSGAVIAAIYHRFALEKGDALEQKSKLAKLENYFHGSSSGLDPLVSLVKKPLLIHNTNDAQVVSDDINLDNFFLLDTGFSRQAATFVRIYQSKMLDESFRNKCIDVLCTRVDLAISALLKNNPEKLFEHVVEISKFQIENFKEMIPDEVCETWKKGIESREYALKLCGAGGGGFILGMKNPSETKKTDSMGGFSIIDV